jgi:hypothetical protein
MLSIISNGFVIIVKELTLARSTELIPSAGQENSSAEPRAVALEASGSGASEVLNGKLS